MSTPLIRSPAVAGLFYPGDASALAATVDALLAPHSPQATARPVRVLLSPHAGYAYSGAIAAHGFGRLRSDAPTRAFIIGPSHVDAFGFTSVFDGDAYRTPLGDVVVDNDAVRALVDSDSSIRRSESGHVTHTRERGEHGIEVLLPFLQRLFPGICIVPIVMGVQSWNAGDALGRAIAGVADWGRDIVIASSDLSHFHDDMKARALDQVFCNTLMTLDAAALHERIARGECEACGAGPVVAALIATLGLRNREGELLASANSSAVNQDRSSVVGYAAAVVTGDPA
jgi:AmmeMemoRadiSam system protein B